MPEAPKTGVHTQNQMWTDRRQPAHFHRVDGPAIVQRALIRRADPAFDLYWYLEQNLKGAVFTQDVFGVLTERVEYYA